jgi:hypothetical protein
VGQQSLLVIPQTGINAAIISNRTGGIFDGWTRNFEYSYPQQFEKKQVVMDPRLRPVRASRIALSSLAHLSVWDWLVKIVVWVIRDKESGDSNNVFQPCGPTVTFLAM